MRITTGLAARSAVPLIAVALALATPGPAAAAPVSASGSAVAAVRTAVVAETADERIDRAMRKRVTTARFGTSFSFYVADAASGRRIWSRNARTALMPASTTKLVTAHNALMTFGPDKRFTTFVKRGQRPNQVIVQGVGDPSLSGRQLDAMARTVAATMTSQGVGTTRVFVDDDRFPTPSLAYGWKSSYVPNSVSPIRALIRDQRDYTDTSVDVGRYFASRVAAYGMPATFNGRANAASSAQKLASSQGDRVSDIVSRMLLVSDNEIAEAVHRLVAYEVGQPTTWDGARTAQKRAMSNNGLPMSALYDGSGLSRAGRLTSEQLATLVIRGADTTQASLWPLRSSQAMPTAGQTGSLAAKYSRFATSQSKCAVGKVWAKTGTLNDVVSLAGYTYGTDGRLKVFAFVVNGKSSSLSLKQSVDMLAATVNGCY